MVPGGFAENPDRLNAGGIKHQDCDQRQPPALKPDSESRSLGRSLRGRMLSQKIGQKITDQQTEDGHDIGQVAGAVAGSSRPDDKEAVLQENEQTGDRQPHQQPLIPIPAPFAKLSKQLPTPRNRQGGNWRVDQQSSIRTNQQSTQAFQKLLPGKAKIGILKGLGFIAKTGIATHQKISQAKAKVIEVPTGAEECGRQSQAKKERPLTVDPERV